MKLSKEQKEIVDLLNDFFSKVKLNYNHFKGGIVCTEDSKSGQAILDIEKKNPDFVISKNTNWKEVSVTPISLLSTVTKILTGSYLSFILDDETYEIKGVKFLSLEEEKKKKKEIADES